MSNYRTTGPGALGPSGAPSWSGRARAPFELSNDNIIHAAHEAIITVDERQRVVMINPAAQRMFGCSASDALGSPLSRFIPEQHRKAHAQHVRDFDASGTAERAMGARSSIVGLRANGQEFPAEATISRVDVSTEFGPQRYFTALLRDLTEMRSLQAEVEALQRRMRGVFDLAPIAIWITDGDEVVFANRACMTLFGADSQAALIGRSIYSLLHPESHAPMRQTLSQALETDQPIPISSEKIARLDGDIREVEIAVAPLPDHHRTTLQMVITDITQRVREKEQLERSRQQLRQLSANLVDAREEERRRIAREMHDELGQRLTALHMELSDLRSGEGVGAHGTRVGSMIEMVDETIATVRRITTDLRPLMLDDLGLNAAIDWLANGWARRMGIAVTLRLGGEDPPVEGAASIALYRMVQEALTNIARHAQASKVAISLRRERDTLVLTVEDNGTGFSEQAMFRAGSHGLLGIRERAYMLGGTMEIGNAARGGGRLTVRLPLDRPSRLPDDGASDPASSVAPAMER